MEEYIKIAQKCLAVESPHLCRGLCFTIRYDDLKNSSDPEQFIKEKLSSICYDFSVVRDFADEYGVKYILFCNE